MSEPQAKLLTSVLKRASKAPYYRNRFPEAVSTLDEWRNIPLTTKADLRLAYPFGLLAVGRKELATYHESSGSSGEPTSSYFTDADWDDIASRFLRNSVDIGPEDAVLVKTPYSMVTTAHQMHRAARLRGALVVPGDNRSSNMPYSKVVRLLHDIPVSVTWSLPTETLLWAAAAKLAGYVPAQDFKNLRAMVVAGEPLGEAKRKRIEKLWGGVQVFQDYGSTETGSLAGECLFHRLHLWSDRLFFEVIDPQSGKVGEEGLGQLVVTPLYREAMPLVRYLVDDRVEIRSEECPCGFPFPVIRVLGREKGPIHVQDQDLCSADLEAAVYSLPEPLEVLFWRARHDRWNLELEIEAAPGAEALACSELQQSIRSRLGILAKVRIAPDGIVSRKELTRDVPFLKPRFLFRTDEDWSFGIHCK